MLRLLTQTFDNRFRVFKCSNPTNDLFSFTVLEVSIPVEDQKTFKKYEYLVIFV